MTTATKMRPKALILYQGQNSSPLKEETVSYLSTQKHFDPITLNDGNNAFGQILYAKLIGTLANCQIAIALITPDPRPSSSSGNIWIEIGLWCGIKSPNSLLMLAHEDVTDLPSNILGNVIKRFNSIDTVKSAISDFISVAFSQNQIPYINIYNNFDEIATKISYGFTERMHDIASIHQLLKCDDHNVNCFHKENLYHFGSELMRIRTTMREHFTIQYCLSRIEYYISRIEQLRSPKDEDLRLIKAEHLYQLISFMKTFSKEHLVRTTDEKDFDPIQRLKQFLEYRLQVARKQQLRGVKFQGIGSANSIMLHLDSFIKWLDESLEHQEKYDHSLTIFDKESRKSLHKALLFSREMTIVLNELGSILYTEIHEHITNHLNKIDNISKLAIAISAIMEQQFPHNKVEVDTIRIWPRTAEEKKLDENNF